VWPLTTVSGAHGNFDGDGSIHFIYLTDLAGECEPLLINHSDTLLAEGGEGLIVKANTVAASYICDPGAYLASDP